MRPGSVHDGTERPPSGIGRISAPWLRQSARPRWTRRAKLLSITGHLLWSGPQGAATPLGRFYIRAPPWRRDLGAKRAPAGRERKGGDPKNRKVRWSSLTGAFLGCPGAHERRC